MKYLFLLLIASCTTSPTMESPEIINILPAKINKDKIFEIVANSPKCTQYKWKDRSIAPKGYIKGMSLVFAKNYCQPLKNFKEKGRAVNGLEWYGKPRTTVAAFTLLTGLGMRESSGKYCVGRDSTNPLTFTPTGAEAGTHQTSYNAAYSVQVNGSPKSADEMRAMIPEYQEDSSHCYLDTFKEGVDYEKKCAGWNAKNWGTGIGLEYQKLSKSCPTMHIEFTLLTMLSTKAHYGPLLNKAAEYNLDCEAMFQDIAEYLDSTDCLL